MIFIPGDKIIVFESFSVTAQEIYAAWEDWVLLSDNAKHPQAMRAFGGDDTSPGQRAPQYYFFMNGWKGRVMEDDGETNVSGLLYSEDGLKPVLDPVGNYKTNIVYEKPLLAVAYDSSGVPAPTVEEIVAGIIAAGIGGSLTPEQNTQLMTKVATKNDLFTI